MTRENASLAVHVLLNAGIPATITSTKAKGIGVVVHSDPEAAERAARGLKVARREKRIKGAAWY